VARGGLGHSALVGWTGHSNTLHAKVKKIKVNFLKARAIRGLGHSVLVGWTGHPNTLHAKVKKITVNFLRA